ncbi:hypothetical protein PENTCL1PPCAC_4789 [Pristionchus entomophagus]|uniref:Uncharacterized protein n=1 Tax=Pristionchus entomophagus TaxID=358040 RepID=A0AAV5SR20_9BILA|nr:hypothetical protein PENTCL1PPCAC_4789 [Pristionchus entomophagus]
MMSRSRSRGGKPEDGTFDDIKQKIPKCIRGYEYDTAGLDSKTKKKYLEKTKAEVVLDDDFLSDPQLRLVVEWVGLPDKKNFTKETPANIQTTEGRSCISEFIKSYFNRSDETPKKTDREHASDWFSLSTIFQPTHISKMTDILPMAAQFTDETEEKVRVRVATLNENFYRKVIVGAKIEERYPIEWNGAQMFVTMDAEEYKETFPVHSQLIFKAAMKKKN